jgi:hypothetical protein
MRLVVRGVHQGRAVGLNAIAERKRRVVQVLGADRGVPHLEDALDQVVVADLGRELVQSNGEVLVLHLPGEDMVERLDEAMRAEDLPPAPRHEQRGEEGDPLDVVPVGVADQDRTGRRQPGGGAFLHQRQPQAAGAGTAIQHQQRAATGPHLDT